MLPAWRQTVDPNRNLTPDSMKPASMRPASMELELFWWIPRLGSGERGATSYRHVLELVMQDEEVARLTTLSPSRTDPLSQAQRAQMLPAYRETPFFAMGQRLGVHHQTVQPCIERALAYGPLMALDGHPRPRKEPTIMPEAKA
jgi:hypothetical protein